MASNPSTLATAAGQAARALAPLADLLDTGGLIGLFGELGFFFPPELVGPSGVGQALPRAALAAARLPDLIDKLDAASSADLVTLLTATSNLLDALVEIGIGLDELASALIAIAGQLPGLSSGDVVAFAGELVVRLFDYLVITYLEGHFPRLTALLALLGVVEIKPEQTASTDPARPPFVRRRLNLDNIPTLLKSPQDFMRQEYHWGLADFDGDLLLSRVADLLFAFTVPALFRHGSAALPPTLQVLLFSLATKRDLTPPGLQAQLAFTLQDQFTLEFPFFIDGWTIEVVQQGKLSAGLSAVITPPGNLSLVPPSGTIDGKSTLGVVARNPTRPLEILSLPGGARITAQRARASIGVEYRFDAGQGAAVGAPVLEFRLEGAQFNVSSDPLDGFTKKVTPSNGIGSSSFDIGIGWSPPRGVFFTGGALETVIPVHKTLGPFRIDLLRLRIAIAGDGHSLALTVGVVGAGIIGPVTALFDAIGFKSELSFQRGSLGPLDLGIDFSLPTGIGIAVDAGPVRGGGFLSFDSPRGRYSGAIELLVYGVGVKAFGLIETKLPDGTQGFSFVIVISAEFTPIQLGFGFTLLGVGGLVGINRSLNDDALRGSLRDGSLDNLLFPADPVRDAPTIIQNLANVFPAAPGHFVFGPTAKLGWGTPTLVHGDLGIVLELPGPRLAILGVIRTSLPSADFALVRLQLAVAGILDFPAQRFSLDAELYDSYVGSFPVQGGMAFRLDFGGSPNFTLAIGGFNTSYKAPPGFPAVSRVLIDLGVNGNPSLTAYGYLAITPNTAQVGAGIDLRAHGGGIRLEGHLGFDALFVFSPFSFKASIDASVSIKFHGVGFGIHLHGTLSGPTPWHLDGEVCVSVLWWDACLGVDITFGESRRAELPPLDPWFGPDPFDAQLSLRAAIQDSRNWSGGATAASPSVVSLAARPPGVATPVDPVGAATLLQKVVPLNQKISKFGEFHPVGHDTFKVKTVLVGGQAQQNVVPVQGDFVPAHFREMSNAARLSSKPYDKMDAGFTIDPHLATVGAIGEKPIVYETQLLDPRGNGVRLPDFQLTRRHLLGMLTRSAAALGGSRRVGLGRYLTPLVKVTLGPERFVVADSCTLAPNTTLTPLAGVAQIVAALAVDAHLAATPGDRGRFAVVPTFELFR